MIRELICYKCECAKCGHGWTTKGHELPRVCSKCKSEKWNDDHTSPDSVTEAIPSPAIRPDEAIPAELSKDEKLEVLRGMLNATSSVRSLPEPQDNWFGWSEEQTRTEGGRLFTFRVHTKTGKKKIIREESDPMSSA